jgi:hypothetical protein
MCAPGDSEAFIRVSPVVVWTDEYFSRAASAPTPSMHSTSRSTVEILMELPFAEGLVHTGTSCRRLITNRVTSTNLSMISAHFSGVLSDRA